MWGAGPARSHPARPAAVTRRRQRGSARGGARGAVAAAERPHTTTLQPEPAHSRPPAGRSADKSASPAGSHPSSASASCPSPAAAARPNNYCARLSMDLLLKYLSKLAILHAPISK